MKRDDPFTYLPPSNSRAAMGIFGLVSLLVGAGILWGPGGVFFTIGLFFWIECSTDEAVERFTRTRRGGLAKNDAAGDSERAARE